eukprot:5986899-Prymnesium_polylepis.1
MATLNQMPLDGVQPLAKQQRAASMESVLSAPAELTGAAMDDAATSIDLLIDSSAADNVAEGTVEKLLGSIGLALAGTAHEEAATATTLLLPPPLAPPLPPPLPLLDPPSQSVNGTLPPLTPPPGAPPPPNPPGAPLVSTNATNATNASAAVVRSSALRNSTNKLAGLVLKGKVSGEAPTAVSAQGASLRAGLDDPCN